MTREDSDRLAESGEERPVVSAELVASERQALRDGSSALVLGVSYAQIGREWNAAGLRTVWGRTWVAIGVRDVLIRGINAGLIEHEEWRSGGCPATRSLIRRCWTGYGRW
ncbi:hypothetical protein [Amycolatopsis antarctica]|uniref:hypothetical protein n=1 Tax=Amycolatopsis antarctica TaxID=1854586 RepID=UPI0013FD4B05|nr:hypothetical protein [Amycolatopsis antarctica]